MNFYTQGTLIQVSIALTTPTGALIDAQNLAFRVKSPSGVVTDYSSAILNPSTGNYTCAVLADQIGLFQYEWLATGTVQASAVGQFLVNQGTF
jgi:hypothetical protein